MLGVLEPDVLPASCRRRSTCRRRRRSRRCAGCCSRRCRPRRPAGSCGSIATQPMEYEPSPSKIGVQVVPALSVFQTPPEAAATYQAGLVRGIDGDVDDAAGGQRRADAAQLEAGEGVGGVGLLRLLRLLLLVGGEKRGRSEQSGRENGERSSSHEQPPDTPVRGVVRNGLWCGVQPSTGSGHVRRRPATLCGAWSCRSVFPNRRTSSRRYYCSRLHPAGVRCQRWPCMSSHSPLGWPSFGSDPKRRTWPSRSSTCIS